MSTTLKVIAYDELRDYLAARGKHLLIYRWAERHVIFSYDTDLPWTDESTRQVDGGQLVLSAPWDNQRKSGLIIRSELDQYFLIPPAKSPSHWRLSQRREVEYYADFVDEHGDVAEEQYSPGKPQIISLNRSVLTQFNTASRPGWEAEETDQGRIYLSMPGHEGLLCSNSKHGQIQVLLRDLGKLSRQNQQTIAPYSETKRGEPTPEWYDCFFNCIPPEPNPWHKQIRELQQQLHDALHTIVIDLNPIVCPPNDDLRRVLIRPHRDDEQAFFKIAAMLRNSLFIDSKRQTMWFRDEVCPAFDDERGSIGAVQGLIRHLGDDEQAKTAKTGFSTLNLFRQVDAHNKTAESALTDAKYEGTDYAEHYTRLMTDVVRALKTSLQVLDDDQS